MKTCFLNVAKRCPFSGSLLLLVSRTAFSLASSSKMRLNVPFPPPKHKHTQWNKSQMHFIVLPQTNPPFPFCRAGEQHQLIKCIPIRTCRKCILLYDTVTALYCNILSISNSFLRRIVSPAFAHSQTHSYTHIHMDIHTRGKHSARVGIKILFHFPHSTKRATFQEIVSINP